MDTDRNPANDEPHSNPQSPVERVPLKSLGLRAGMALQTRRLVEGTSKKESQYIGAIEGKGVMVGPVSADAEQTGLCEGEVCVVRGFTGRHEFSFLSKVLQTFEKPFVYALLAYPTLVDARLVRQSMRVRTQWPAQVASAQAPDTMHPATLLDLSTAGAMLSLAQALAPVGDMLRLTLEVVVDGSPSQLALNGRICHGHRLADSGDHCLGMAFVQPSAQDRLLLSYLTQNPD
ncbi:MAG: PilZ domain-containing protein [Rhodoferax sp.]